MGKGHLQKLTAKIRWYLTAIVFASGLSLLALDYLLSSALELSGIQALVGLLFGWLVLSVVFGMRASSLVNQPLRFLAQAILHVSPSEHLVGAPDTNKLKIGRELVTNLVRQIYDFASGGANVEEGLDQASVMNQLPLAVIGLDAGQKIVFANPQAEKYLSPQKSLAGQNFFGAFNLSYGDNASLSDWLTRISEEKVTATNTWERVRLNLSHATPKYFDMSVSYSKHSPSGVDTLIAIFDRTESYSTEDKSLSFVALVVHELRTPLTILRGYIEALDEELAGKLDSQTTEFMQKMQASAESLTTFVGNILNVARVEQDELVLQLNEETWPQLLQEIVNAMQLRASVHGKTIGLEVGKDLPTVAVDKVSIAEVLNNLLDNAIKYSPEGADRIIVRSAVDKDGMIETTVQDFGIGIPRSVMPHLFEKFYRNHRSKASVGGSGLGLYLSKAIVTAHEGKIWVRSEDGEGSTFGFSLLPYAQLAEERKNSDNEITRGAHGWIKNHSLQRR